MLTRFGRFTAGPMPSRQVVVVGEAAAGPAQDWNPQSFKYSTAALR